MHGWRSFLLRLFGAQIGRNCRIAADLRIWAPWNLQCGDAVMLGDGAEIYNQGTLEIDSNAVISQGAYICCSTHDYNSAEFPLLAYHKHIKSHAWICAHAIVGPTTDIGEGAVLGIGSVATSDLLPWTVYAGNPAIARKSRENFVDAG